MSHPWMKKKLLGWSGQPTPRIAKVKSKHRGVGDPKRGLDPLPYKSGPLATKLRKLKSATGFSDTKLASELEVVTGVTISTPTIWNWRNGKNLPGGGDKLLVAAVMNGISELANRATLYEEGAWVTPSEIKATVEQWQNDLGGISIKHLASKLDVPYTTMQRWAAGLYHVPRQRIAVLQKKVARKTS